MLIRPCLGSRARAMLVPACVRPRDRAMLIPVPPIARPGTRGEQTWNRRERGRPLRAPRFGGFPPPHVLGARASLWHLTFCTCRRARTTVRLRASGGRRPTGVPRQAAPRPPGGHHRRPACRAREIRRVCGRAANPSKPGPARLGLARLGLAWLGLAWPGLAWLGPLGPAWPGPARLCLAGLARPGRLAHASAASVSLADSGVVCSAWAHHCTRRATVSGPTLPRMSSSSKVFLATLPRIMSPRRMPVFVMK